MKKLYLLFIALLFTASFTAVSAVQVGNFYFVFNGVTNNPDGTSTWSYTVSGTGSGQALSHWNLALCDDHTVLGSNYPYEVGLDANHLNFYSIKWDIGINNNESKTFTVTLQGWWESGDVQVGYKSSGDIFKGFITGPTCTPLVQKASLGDKVWLDADKDGVQDAGEAGVPNVKVELLDCNGNVLETMFTDGNGNYLFDNLDAGDYTVRFTLPDGYVFTVKDAGSSDAADSDADPVTGKTTCITLSAGEDDMTWDAGIYLKPAPLPASLGDKVWLDTDKDGIQDAGETGVPNVKVELMDCNGNVLESMFTDGSGNYLFDNLDAGDYTVRFTLPDGYVFTVEDAGSNDAADSDADQVTGKTTCITLSAGENDMTWDAGIYQVPTPVNPDLKIEKTVNDPDPECGDDVTFTIKVTNLGPGSSANVLVGDLLPQGLTYKSSVPSQGTYDQATGEWSVGTLAEGAFASLTVTAEVVCSGGTSTIDLGPAKGFNLFVLEDLVQPSSDTEGKVAVGHDASFSGYTLGASLPAGSGDVLIVGHNLTYTSGSIHGGNVVYGNATNLPVNAVTITDGTIRKDNVIDFAAAAVYLQNLSTTLSVYPANGTTAMQWGSINLTGTDAVLNVFSVSGSDLASAHTVNITAPSGSVVIVNIAGTNVSWHGGLFLNGVSQTNVIYNFYQAAGVTIYGINVQGVLLAPFAALNYSAGLITGQAIVKSMSGTGQFNLNLFTGSIPTQQEITNVASLLNSSPADPNPLNNTASAVVKTGVSGGNSGGGDNVGSNLPVPTPSWPVGNPTEYNNPPKLNWYIGTYAPELYYTVQYAAEGKGWDEAVTATTNTLSYLIQEILLSGVQYTWRVRSTDGTNNSEWSVSALFTMAENAAGNPVVPIPSWPVNNPTVYSNPPKLNWYIGTYAPGLIYHVQYVLDGKPWTEAANFSISALSFQIPDMLNSGARYTWRVSSTNGASESAWSEPAVFTMAESGAQGPVVPTPSWPVGNPTEYNSHPILYWYIGTYAPGLTYEVKYTIASDNDWELAKTLTSTALSTAIPEGLTSGVQYAWKVRSILGTQKSNWSAPELFTMSANNGAVQPVPGSPVNSATVNNSAPQLFWYLPTPTSGISTYEVQLADNADFAGAQTLSSAEPNIKVNGLQDGREYYWKVRSVDAAGNSSFFSGVGSFKVSSTTAVEDIEEVPVTFELSQNYPNPFNPSTVIRFAIPAAGTYSLRVYDMLGQEVTELVNGELQIGVHEVTFDAGNLTSGTYIYRLAGNGVSLTRKMMLIK